MPTVTASSTSLSGGVTSVAEEGQSVTSLTSAFEDAEQIDVNLLIGGDLSSANANLVIGIAAKRKDCVAFVSPPLNATVGNNSAASAVKTWADSVTSSSYGVMDSTAGYMYDKYNDVYRWVPASGSTAGLCANADSVADSWFSPAGLNRGQIRTFAKLAFNPKQVERDTLYKARVNPIVSFPGEGTVLFGDKTALAKPSAFDRINVRRLFITIEKAIATASKFSLFEFNDEFTRAQFLNLVEPFLRDVQGRRGITDFRVVCDETNNTGEVIDTNRFVSDIYIKPARSINFITLSFIATRTGVDFSEIVGG
jgi:phage tail sheath protein FI